MKEQLAAGLGEGQIAELVEHDKIHTREIFGKPTLAAGAGFGFEPVDEVDGGVEAASGAAADASPRNGNGQMRLAGAGSTDQYSVALLRNKRTVRQMTDQRRVDRRASEIEVVDVLGQRQFGDGQLLLD